MKICVSSLLMFLTVMNMYCAEQSVEDDFISIQLSCKLPKGGRNLNIGVATAIIYEYDPSLANAVATAVKQIKLDGITYLTSNETSFEFPISTKIDSFKKYYLVVQVFPKNAPKSKPCFLSDFTQLSPQNTVREMSVELKATAKEEKSPVVSSQKDYQVNLTCTIPKGNIALTSGLFIAKLYEYDPDKPQKSATTIARMALTGLHHTLDDDTIIRFPMEAQSSKNKFYYVSASIYQRFKNNLVYQSTGLIKIDKRGQKQNFNIKMKPIK